MCRVFVSVVCVYIQLGAMIELKPIASYSGDPALRRLFGTGCFTMFSGQTCL